ncbi:hypothetical protein A3L09_06245 [Thermococcus profundus]|uniref:Uncharacterized protein n=1 Tax=Thermococcus profundus TaxID=49899 RepID=A0A2Z2MAS0_THEPR|nr:hypothetical protein [Thermococcus profundus]ASJ02886.1 hypothetical protein A3L09_06245 [Thermococcus profundus]
MVVLYSFFMGLGGLLTLSAIFLTWNLSQRVELGRLGKRRISWCILLGGLLTAIGFFGMMENVESNIVAFLVILGPALIAYALSESGLVKATSALLIQSFLLLPLVLLRKDLIMDVVELGSTLSQLLLINAVVGYVRTPPEYRSLAGLSAWGVLISVWFISFDAVKLAGSVIYLISVALWLYTLLRLHTVSIERFHNSAQEGL